MTDIEDLVAKTLRDRAGDAPRAMGLPDDVRGLHSRRNRTRAGLIAGTVAVVVAAAIAVPVALVGDHSTRPAPTPSETTHPVATTPPGMQAIAFHGIEIDVPASWSINAQHCGTPTENTVLRDLGGVALCLVPRPSHVSDVELLDNPAEWVPHAHGLQRFTNAHGVGLEEGSLPPAPRRLVVVPRVGVAMFLTVQRASLGRQIVNSIRIVSADQYGCDMRATHLYPTAPPRLQRHTRPRRAPDGHWVSGGLQLLQPLLPTNPVDNRNATLSICKYTNGWLTASTQLAGSAFKHFVRLVNALPPGPVHAPSASYLHSMCTDRHDTEWRSGYVLHLFQPAVDRVSAYLLYAHVQICGPLGIAHDRDWRALTPKLATALNAPLHTGYETPGQLLPGPP